LGEDAQTAYRRGREAGSNIVNPAIQRSILRWIHLLFAIPIIGYVYSPFEDIPNYAPVVRFVALPAIVLTGFWMWQGHALRRLISKGDK
jgi:hypothetical protein